jgi:hypothetical protein
MTTVDDCRVIDFPRILRSEGNLTAVHGQREVPFDIARLYYLYDVPGGESRGGHSHRELQQVIVSAMGSFCVELDDGQRRKSVRLSRAYYGLYVPPMIWRELVDFSSGGICLVLASLPFEEGEYIRDYQDFISRKR